MMNARVVQAVFVLAIILTVLVVGAEMFVTLHYIRKYW